MLFKYHFLWQMNEIFNLTDVNVEMLLCLHFQGFIIFFLPYYSNLCIFGALLHSSLEISFLYSHYCLGFSKSKLVAQIFISLHVIGSLVIWCLGLRGLAFVLVSVSRCNTSFKCVVRLDM